MVFAGLHDDYSGQSIIVFSIMSKWFSSQAVAVTK